MTHVLKTTYEAWHAVESGAKRFEVRKNDRLYQTGDIVELQCLRQGDCSLLYSSQTLRFRVGFVLHGGQFGLQDGYVAFQLEPMEAS